MNTNRPTQRNPMDGGFFFTPYAGANELPKPTDAEKVAALKENIDLLNELQVRKQYLNAWKRARRNH